MRLLLVWLVACGTSPAPIEEPDAPPPVVPSIADLPVYDVTIAEAPATIQDAWAAVRILLDAPPPERDTARVAWMRDRAHAIAELEDDLEPLRDGDPRDRLFASAVLAALTDQLYVATREMPADVEDPEVRASFEDIVATFGLAARGQYLRCAAVEQVPESMSGWASVCAARARALEVLMPVDPTVALCAAEEEYVLRQAPPRDESAPPAIAVVTSDERFTGRARDQLLSAVHRRVEALRDELVIPLAEVRTAARLVEERRWVEDGPVCGQAPSFEAILAHAHPNLILADVHTECEESGCTLSVWGTRPDSTELALHMAADVTGSASAVSSWVRAAGRLSAPPGPAGVGSAPQRGGLPRLPDGLVLRVRDLADDDPLLRVGPTLRWMGQMDLAACAPAADGVGVYAVELALAPNGAVESAEVTVENEPRGADGAAVSACLEQAIRAQEFPCPRPGQTNRASFRVCLGRDG